MKFRKQGTETQKTSGKKNATFFPKTRESPRADSLHMFFKLKCSLQHLKIIWKQILSSLVALFHQAFDCTGVEKVIVEDIRSFLFT